MHVSIRLADADRERLGVQVEWLDVDLDSVTAREVMVMKAGFTIPETGERVAFRTPDAWSEALRGHIITDEQGQPVLHELVDEQGQPVIDEETGKPRQVPLREPDWAAELFMIWIALRRGGVYAPIGELDYDLAGRQFRFVRDETDPPAGEESTAGSEGKDDAPEPGSGPSESATSTS